MKKFWSLILGILLASIGAQAGYPVQFFGNGVYGAWRDSVSVGMPVSATAIWGFDTSIPGGGGMDWTGNGNNLTMVGTVPFGANGAGPFSTANYFSIPPSLFASKSSWSISLWAYISSTTNSPQGFRLLDSSPSRIFDFEVNAGANAFRFGLTDGVNPRKDFDTTVILNKWTHLAFTYDNGNCSAYINGLSYKIDTVESFSWGIGTTKLLGIGASTRPWVGYLKDFRVFSVALTPAEIAALSANTVSKQYFTSANTGLVADWEFEQSVADSSGNGNNLSMVGTVPLNVTGTAGNKGMYAAGPGGNGNYFKIKGDYFDNFVARTSGVFSVVGWCYLTTTAAGANSFVSVVGNNSSNMSFRINAGNYGVIQSRNVNGSNDMPVGTITKNVWHMWAYTANNGSSIGYYDGAQIGISTKSPLESVSESGVNVLSYNGNNNTFVIGYIDSIRFYNRILSASEISALYTNTLDKNITNAHWRRRR